MKVTVKDPKTGREKTMPKKHADILEKLGRATYLTRDMVAGTASEGRAKDSGPAPRRRRARQADKGQ
jgi:hypothetical protein